MIKKDIWTKTLVCFLILAFMFVSMPVPFAAKAWAAAPVLSTITPDNGQYGTYVILQGTG
ncbi:MAG: hypothetical protein GYA14_14970, partial [Ignavibacteria bacterium]|nr:hypothetical protein [Ignavibacteria bacterium]